MVKTGLLVGLAAAVAIVGAETRTFSLRYLSSPQQFIVNTEDRYVASPDLPFEPIELVSAGLTYFRLEKLEGVVNEWGKIRDQEGAYTFLELIDLVSGAIEERDLNSIILETAKSPRRNFCATGNFCYLWARDILERSTFFQARDIETLSMFPDSNYNLQIILPEGDCANLNLTIPQVTRFLEGWIDIYNNSEFPDLKEEHISELERLLNRGDPVDCLEWRKKREWDFLWSRKDVRALLLGLINAPQINVESYDHVVR
ncbi:MAG: hypothetical protein ABH817_01900 [archaeon]